MKFLWRTTLPTRFNLVRVPCNVLVQDFQSGSLSGRAQTSGRRLAMTRQASLKIAQPFMAG
jgi:hypothetical protein